MVLPDLLIRSLKGTWGRLNTELPADHHKRLIIIECCVRLHNLRARFDLQNQIRTVYRYPELHGLASLAGRRVNERQGEFWELRR